MTTWWQEQKALENLKKERRLLTETLIHRVIVGHAPMEICPGCPQPLTDETIIKIKEKM